MVRDPARRQRPRTTSGRSRWRELALTAALTTAAVVLGISGAGVTSALLSDSATQDSVTVSAGTLGIQINGDESAVLAPKRLSPAAPASWPFRVANSGDARTRLSALVAAPGGPTYAASARALLAPVADSASCTASLAGTPAALDGYSLPAMGTLGVGQGQWYCLVVSLPAQVPAGSGQPLSFTLTVNAVQID